MPLFVGQGETVQPYNDNRGMENLRAETLGTVQWVEYVCWWSVEFRLNISLSDQATLQKTLEPEGA